MTAAAESTITSVNFQPGDKISAGDVVMTLTSDELESQLESLQDDLSSTRSSLASAKQYLTNLNINATKSVRKTMPVISQCATVLPKALFA